MRVDLLRNRFAVPMGEGELSDEGRDSQNVGWSPRLGARLKLAGDWLSWRTSIGHYFRPPTMMELFGDRGYIVGNEGLRPESGQSLDGGLVWQIDRGAALQLQASASVFANWSQHLIQWVPAGLVIRPANIKGARSLGSELSLALDAWQRMLRVQASYTFLDTRNFATDPAAHGKALPGRPRHDLYTRLALATPKTPRFSRANFELFATYESIAGTFLDPSGRYELPSRQLLGAGCALDLANWVVIAAEWRNLTNVRTATIENATAQPPTQKVPVADFLGYPLPGRAFWLSVRFNLQNPRTPKVST